MDPLQACYLEIQSADYLLAPAKTAFDG